MAMEAGAGVAFQDEVADRFGVLPNFFCTAGSAPGLIDELWSFAKSAYLDSALPSLFKERLFVQLSRFCEIRYCIVRHVGFLVGHGRPAGDAEAVPESVDDVIALLSRPMPDASQLAASLDRLRAAKTAPSLPAPGTQAEADLFDALTVIFVEPARSALAREGVRAAVGEQLFELLTAYLAFVRTAHFWTETHPELAYEPDMLALMEQRPDLQQLLLSPADAERVRAGGDLRRILAELHQTEAALRESETRNRLLIQSMAQAVWETDAAGVVVADSPSWRAYTGQTLTEWLGDGWLDAVHPDDRAYAEQQWREAVAARGLVDAEFRLCAPDGGWRWTNVRAAPVLDEAGTIEKWAGINIDIDARKRAEKALREGDERRAFLLELSDTLRPIRDPTQIMAHASALLGRRLAAGRCGYGEVDDSGQYFIVHRDWTDDVMPSFCGTHLLEGFGPEFVAAYRAGRTVRIDDALGDARAAGKEAAFEAAGGVRASLGVPMVKEGRFVAGIFVQQLQPRHWTAQEETLAIEVAERTWDAVERARAEQALRESEERRELALEATQMGTFVWHVQEDRSEPDARLLALFDQPPDGMMSLRYALDTVIHPDDRASYAAAVAEATRPEGSRSFREDIRVRHGDGSVHWLEIRGRVSFEEDGQPLRMAGTALDVTERKAAESRQQQGDARQRALIEGLPQLVWRAVDGGDWTWASPQWTAFTGQAEADSHGSGWLAPVHPDDRDRVKAVWAGAVARGDFHADYRICHPADGHYRWFQTRATPVRDEAGEIVEWLGSSTDIQDLRGLQERQRVLLHELQHRVRNTLAIVRSLFKSTAQTSETVEEFAAHFEGRLNALARTQVVLTRSAGAGVDLETLVREELLAQAPTSKQIIVDGPDVVLSAKAAEVLALAVHELATNAVKYGALSGPDGRISVRWSAHEEGGERWLDMDWQETGVPVLSPAPRREGFGTELVTLRVPYELKGRGELHLRPGGMQAQIAFPLRPGESILQTDAPGE